MVCPITFPVVLLYVREFGKVIVYELLNRGYTEVEINKILSENFFRVWKDVIEIADSLNLSSTI